jgi:hypothetical protein
MENYIYDPLSQEMCWVKKFYTMESSTWEEVLCLQNSK